MTEAKLFASTADADFDAIGDAHEQITSTAARFGQAFVGNADRFMASDAAANWHAHHGARNSPNYFRATLRGSLGSDFQIAAQIRTAHFEAEIRLSLHAQLHIATGKWSGAR